MCCWKVKWSTGARLDKTKVLERGCGALISRDGEVKPLNIGSFSRLAS